jgi:hypothetical protein
LCEVGYGCVGEVGCGFVDFTVVFGLLCGERSVRMKIEILKEYFEKKKNEKKNEK